MIFFEVKAVIEEHYGGVSSFTGMSTRRCHEAERELGSGRKVREIMGML